MLGRSTASRPTVIGIAVLAVLCVAWLVVGLLGAFTATDGGTISVIRNGGLLDNRAVRTVDGRPQIVPPGSSLTYTGMFSSEHPYPAGQRNFVIAARPPAQPSDGEQPVDSREVINVPSKDGVMIGVEGTFYFELTRDPVVLAQFDDKFGTRTYPAADGKAYAAWDGDAGWSGFLNFTLGNLIQNDLRRELVQVSCADLVASCSLASNGTTPAVVAPNAATTDRIQQVQDAVNTQFARDVESTLGGPFFTNIKFVMSKAVLDDKVQSAINDAQAAFAAVTKAQAGKQAAQIEAETNAVRQQGYTTCPTCADIERLKALPPGLTTYAPGQGFAVTGGGDPLLQYHGWLVIEAAPYETETEDADRRAAAGFVQDLVDAATADGVQGLRDLRWVNGQAQFHFGGFRNHRNAEFDGLLASIAELGRRAPGTYGVVHYADDEDPVHAGDFRVVVVRRGEMVEQTDPHLSPVIPRIEDAYVDGEEP